MNTHVLGRLLPSLFLSAFYCNANASVQHMSLKQAMQTNQVLVSAHGTGGYMGKCLKLDMTNITCDPIDITIDPALIFVPGDTNYQNLVVVGDESVELQPDKKETIVLQTFCGKSYAGSPAPNLNFNFWEQGDSVMIKTVKFIRENKYLNHLGQSAVWTLTNGKCISTIYDPSDIESSKKFIAFEALLRRLPVPDYFSYYRIDTSAGSMSCISANGKQYVELDYAEDLSRNVYTIILDENGLPYCNQKITEHIENGNHSVTIMFDKKQDREGIYAVLLRDDNNNILGKKYIRVGADWCY
jgi:hypothetical protein